MLDIILLDEAIDYAIFVVTVFNYLTLFYILFNFSIRESFFSPLNVFVLFQSIALSPLLLYSFNGYIDAKYVADYITEYIENIDKELLLLTVLGYFIFNLSFINFMRFFGYKPITFSLKRFGYLELRVFDLVILLSSLVIIYTYLVNIIVSFKVFEFFYGGTTYEIRFEVTRGSDAIIFKIIEIFVPVVLAVTYVNITSIRTRKNYSKKLVNLLLFVAFAIIFFATAILFGIRGLAFFSLLFIIFLLYGLNFSLAYFLKSFINLKISIHFAYVISLFGLSLIYFYIYSITRGIEGDLATLIVKRADFILASYVSIYEGIIDVNLHKLTYPFTVYIPRNFFENKQYPAVVDITWMIFGPNERFGVEFGIVAESFYVLPFIWLVFSGFLLALVMKFTSQVISRVPLNIYDLFIVKTTYYYVGIQAFGVISPATGDLIFMVPILALLSSLRNKRFRLS